MKKSLHNEKYFLEIRERIFSLKPDSERKWGKMNAAQMLKHCNLVLNVPLGKTVLPQIPKPFQWIGKLTKREMMIFNNGIPRNMPTFNKLIVTFECDFEMSKNELLKTLDLYLKAFQDKKLPGKHVLFGNMSQDSWGFLEFKHLDHHLKQFKV